MNILKLNSGKVEIRKDNGSLIRTIGNGDAVFADFNAVQTQVLVMVNGKYLSPICTEIKGIRLNLILLMTYTFLIRTNSL
jgi:hypothetical protein